MDAVTTTNKLTSHDDHDVIDDIARLAEAVNP